MLIPLVTFEEIDLAAANECLAAWGHKMGPLERGNQAGVHYALLHDGKPVAVAMTSTLIRERVGGGLGHLTRENCCELSRLCAERAGLCRVALRLWREFVFPATGYDYAISYQDADIHNGNTYRFDGWERMGFSHSGTDSRSGRRGRDKWIWVWRHPKTPNSEMSVHFDRESAEAELKSLQDEAADDEGDEAGDTFRARP